MSSTAPDADDIIGTLGLAVWPAIEAVELRRVRIPLLHPHVYAGGEERERDVVVVCAHGADGGDGWGECSTLSSPGYSLETTDSAWRSLRAELGPAWLAGARPSAAPPMAYAALEEAAVDLALRRAGTSLVDALASQFGPRHRSVAWCAVVGLRDDTPTLVDEIRIALEAGAAQVKLKIVPGRDVDVVRSVRDAYPDVALAVDANGSYGSPSMVPSELSSLGLAYLEQPVAPDDLRAASAVAEHLGVPVALDESITSLARLVEALELDACSVVSVKPARLGGLVETVRVLQQAESAGLNAFVGGMLETGIGRAIALAVAAQSPCTLPTDVGPTARYFAEDLTDRFEPNAERRMQAPSGPGIGVVPHEDALERFTVDRVTLRP